MGEKKKPGRFTLQFNMEDPQQRTASEILEQQGRHKAQFIASAVLFYIRGLKPQGCGGEPHAIDEAKMERMLLSILEKHPRFSADGSGESPVPPTKRVWGDAMGDDALKAISDTLAAFQKP